MKWIDYREELGLGFSDDKKVALLGNISNNWEYHKRDICVRYCLMVGESPHYGFQWSEVRDSITKEKSILGMISKYVALINSCFQLQKRQQFDFFRDFLLLSLNDLNLLYEIYEDDDGVFLFPKGAKELDEVTVSEPFEWLKQYPSSRQAMELALKSYTAGDDPSNTADLFRKSLETFVKEFFNQKCTLENAKPIVGEFLKEKGVPNSLRCNFETTLQMYTNYMNDYAKHNSKTDIRFLEFIMYQTGNIIRFILSLSND